MIHQYDENATDELHFHILRKNHSLPALHKAKSKHSGGDNHGGGVGGRRSNTMVPGSEVADYLNQLVAAKERNHQLRAFIDEQGREQQGLYATLQGRVIRGAIVRTRRFIKACGFAWWQRATARLRELAQRATAAQEGKSMRKKNKDLQLQLTKMKQLAAADILKCLFKHHCRTATKRRFDQWTLRTSCERISSQVEGIRLRGANEKAELELELEKATQEISRLKSILNNRGRMQKS